MSKIEEYISKEQALSYPFANGEYDKENANPDFIRGCESYKEWLESLPAAETKNVPDTNVGDTISRQAAIDALGERPIVWNVWEDEYELGQRNQYDSDKLAIETLPSAERHGRWEETTTSDLWECSVCGHTIYSETVLDRKTFHKWCGKCGAKMDEVTDGE